jgi:hypothetical protein
VLISANFLAMWLGCCLEQFSAISTLMCLDDDDEDVIVANPIRRAFDGRFGVHYFMFA